jgi:hypothetical protein
MTEVELALRRHQPPSPEDCEAIRNLLQAYCILVDQGRRDDVADLFTEDSEWDGDSLGHGSAAGPGPIADLVVSHFDPDQPMFHFGGPPLLESAGPDEVNSYMWCIAGRQDSGPPRYLHYVDRLRRDPDRGWLFVRRVLTRRRVL